MCEDGWRYLNGLNCGAMGAWLRLGYFNWVAVYPISLQDVDNWRLTGGGRAGMAGALWLNALVVSAGSGCVSGYRIYLNDRGGTVTVSRIRKCSSIGVTLIVTPCPPKKSNYPTPLTIVLQIN